jgi:hypothetical protein
VAVAAIGIETETVCYVAVEVWSCCVVGMAEVYCTWAANYTSTAAERHTSSAVLMNYVPAGATAVRTPELIVEKHSSADADTAAGIGRSNPD